MTCALVCFAGLACKKAGPPPPPPDPLAPPAEVADLRLPTTSSTTAPADGFRVYLTQKGLFAGKPQAKVADVPAAEREKGFPATLKRSGPNDLYVTPLADAVPKGTDHAVVYVDREIPYRLLVEVLFTLGQREVPRFELAALGRDGRTRSLEILTPRPCTNLAMLKKADEMSEQMLALLGSASASAKEPSPPPPAPCATPSAASSGPPPAALMPCQPANVVSLSMTIVIVSGGFSVKARGGNIAPGCGDVGAGIAVPKSRSNTFDYEGLASCLVKARSAVKDGAVDDDVVTISASPSVPFETLVATMDAARATPEGGALFPKVQLGVTR